MLLAGTLAALTLHWSRRAHRPGSYRVQTGIDRVQTIVLGFSLLLHAAACLAYDAPGALREALAARLGPFADAASTFLSALPPLTLLALGWFCVCAAANTAMGSARSWWRDPLNTVWTLVRHHVLLIALPLMLLLVWADGAGIVSAKLKTTLTSPPRWIDDAVLWTGVAVLLALTPTLIRRIWSTRRFPEGPVRERVHNAAAAHGKSVGLPLLWETDGSIANAAILGFVRPFRYMLLSDLLVSSLSPAQLEAVIAHEAAHVKLRHPLWLGIIVIGITMAMVWCAELAAPHLPTGIAASPWYEYAAAVIALALSVAGLLLASRRFEWQADAFAAKHLSPAGVITGDATDAASGALRMVALLNGIDENRTSLRHGTIAHRRLRLHELTNARADSLPIDRVALRIKITAGFILLVSVTPFLWRDGARRTDDDRASATTAFDQSPCPSTLSNPA